MCARVAALLGPCSELTGLEREYFRHEPYKKLQRALKAEIDEAAWSSLYSTVSRPFDLRSAGKIAVKVINHYGDEVLKATRSLRSVCVQ